MRQSKVAPYRTGILVTALALSTGGAGVLPVAAQSTDSGAGTADCSAAPEPVVSLDHGSRYIDDDDSRSIMDDEANAAVNASLGPIDDFIRTLTDEANAVVADGGDPEAANCVIAQMAEWADAGAMTELGSFGAKLSVGGRIAGFASAYRQVRPFATLTSDADAIEEWLTQLVHEQITFWEEEATSGAKHGNLRGWAALGASLVGSSTQDDVALTWSAFSQSYILCTAREDGSLPQETKRGKYALHYQLHAITALTVNAAVLEEAGLSVKDTCDGALPRAVDFALGDLEAEGAASEEYSGKPQSYFDGTEELGQHEMAWIAAYNTLYQPPLTPLFDTMSNSKLGGDQTLLWPQG